jgi:predicted Fe-Mo cluster-binding NifX family protein
MKIAVASTANTLDSYVDPRFARAAYFIIIDTETNHTVVIENDSISAAGGTGISAAKTVIDAGAKAVITGNCGPNAARTLIAADVRLYTGISTTVKEALELFKAGKLTEAEGPNVQQHFGANS